MRPKIKEKLHRSHIGIQGCLRRAREVVYWPNINRELEEFISKCETCNTFQPAQQKERLICHELPQRPWEKIGCDIFTFHNCEYLCTVDYYSDYFEIYELQKAKTGAVVIGKLKKRVATHGIPDIFHSDNGLPFNSNEFSAFAAMYEFEHITSSPEYPQSNGKVENVVKTSKNLMKKAASTNSDFQLALLDWRNTLTEGMKSSPAQRMFGRRTRTLSPTSKERLEPQLVRDVRERKLQWKEVQTRYFNRNVKELESLDEGDVVRMKPQASNGRRHGPRPKLRNKLMSDPMLLELKMTDCSDGSADIFDSRKNPSWLKMLKLKFQVQFPTVHHPKSTRNQNQHRLPSHIVQQAIRPRTSSCQASSIIS